MAPYGWQHAPAKHMENSEFAGKKHSEKQRHAIKKSKTHIISYSTVAYYDYN